MPKARQLTRLLAATVLACFTGTSLAGNPPGKAGLDAVYPKAPRNSASGAPANWPEATEDSNIYSYTLVDRLEYGASNGPDNYLWDAEGWAGGDYNKLWWKTEGEGPIHRGEPEDTEFQALYNRRISPFWGAQFGVRYDINPNPNRGFLVIGLQGLAPQWVETDNAVFVSEDGDVSFRGEYEYHWLITQRFAVAPRIEINLSVQDVPEYQLGNGINNTEIGMRFRYAIRREFAPYIGVRWEQKYGETKGLARAAGEPTSSTAFVVGVRAWY